RVVGDHGEVGREEQMQAEPDYPSAGGGDDRGLRLEHRRDEPVHLPPHAPLRGTDAGLVAATAFTEVEARAEVLAGTGESEHARGLAAARRFDDLDEGVHHLVGECVAAVGPVEAHAEHGAVVLGDQTRWGRGVVLHAPSSAANRATSASKASWHVAAPPGGSGSRTGPCSRLGSRIVACPGVVISPRWFSPHTSRSTVGRPSTTTLRTTRPRIQWVSPT